MSSKGKIIKFDQQIIDTYTNEATMFFPLKEKEAVLLLSLIPFFKWRTRWDNLTYTQEELNKLAAEIADGLMNPIEGDVIVTTPTELAQAVCDGIMCATPKIGQILAAGINSGISVTVDDEGNIVVSDGTEASTDQDIDATQNELKWGGIEYVYARLLEYHQDFADFYAYSGSDVPFVVSLLSQKYQTNDNLTGAVTDYFFWRGLPSAHPAAPTSTLKGKLFCEGATVQTTSAFIIDANVIPMTLVLSMHGSLLQSQYDTWYAIGKQTPRQGFTTAPCYRGPTEATIIGFSQYVTTTIAWYSQNTINHRWRLEMTGTAYTDADGNKYDGVYYVVAATGVKTYNPLKLTDRVFGNEFTPLFQPAYNAAGLYNLEYLMLDNKSPGGTRYKQSSFTPISGSISMQLIDLGTG